MVFGIYGKFVARQNQRSGVTGLGISSTVLGVKHNCCVFG